MIYVIVFITKALITLNKNRLNLLTKKHFKLIGDKSSSYRYFRNFSKVREISHKSTIVNNWLTSTKYTIDPCDMFRLLWIVLMIVLDSVLMMTITYVVCFKGETWWLPIYIVVVLLDLIIYLNTATYVDGRVIECKVEIIGNKSSALWLDFFVVLGLVL